MDKKKRALSGYRPTGQLHLGHYFGNLTNMIDLQKNYESFFFVADWHALTTEYADPSSILDNTREMILDWVAAGIDPGKSVIYRQSDFPEIAELTLYLGMMTPLPWLERCPTYKEQLRELKGRDLTTFGFLGYPVLMTADILAAKSEIVPVGEDQLPHLELAREIARRFNHFYGSYFPEPQALLSHGKKVPGIDGRKMSKSYDNAINLNDEPDEIRKKVRQTVTDPERIHVSDPGHPKVCAVFGLHKVFSQESIKDIEKKCKNAERGCVDCKNLLTEAIAGTLKEYRQKRKELEGIEGFADQVLREGAARAAPVIKVVVEGVRKKMKLAGI